MKDPASSIIDCDAVPVEPNWAEKGKTVHIQGGRRDAAKLRFFQTEDMERGVGTLDTELSDAMCQAKLIPSNVNALVFLEQNQQFLASVPKHINFLIATETQFLVRYGFWYVRCLCRTRVGRWYFDHTRVNRRFGRENAVVVFTE